MNLRKSLFIVLFFVGFLAFAQSKTITINNHDFLFVVESKDTLDGAQEKSLKLFRGKKELLTHTLISLEGGCSSEHIQLGDYSIVKNNIVFYTYWASADRMPNLLPYGFQKQIYTVNSLGKLSLEESKIYIENYTVQFQRAIIMCQFRVALVPFSAFLDYLKKLCALSYYRYNPQT